ncbi:hypothetical protein BDV12DRAFT_61380 [Aspergillus spectabilis]
MSASWLYAAPWAWTMAGMAASLRVKPSLSTKRQFSCFSILDGQPIDLSLIRYCSPVGRSKFSEGSTSDVGSISNLCINLVGKVGLNPHEPLFRTTNVLMATSINEL